MFSLLPIDSNVYINFRIRPCFKFLKHYNTLEIVGLQTVENALEVEIREPQLWYNLSSFKKSQNVFV